MSRKTKDSLIEKNANHVYKPNLKRRSFLHVTDNATLTTVHTSNHRSNHGNLAPHSMRF
jgi:hypothetical protein